MQMGKVIQASVTEHGHWVTQNVLAYEVRLTSKKPEARWRTNHVVMVIAATAAEAISMCVSQYPDDPIIDQVILRNRGMDVILSEEVLQAEAGKPDHVP